MQQYLDLLGVIQREGTKKPPARANMPGSTSLFGYQFRHNLADGFPLLTTKKMYWKGIVTELLWFLRGDTNIKYLLDNKVNIWNEDAYNYYQKKCNEQGLERRLTFTQFIDFIKNWTKSKEELQDDSYKNSLQESPVIPKNYILGDCGFQYGRVWRRWPVQGTNNNPGLEVDQISNLVRGLKEDSQGRRHILTAWDPAHLNDLALTWCHALVQFNCRPLTTKQRMDYALAHNLITERGLAFDVAENPDRTIEEQLDQETNTPKYYLDCQLYQRSADVVLGVPFNIASYALLTHLLAEICNMVPGEFIHSFGDVHIYDNHMDAVETQLERSPRKLPTLKVLPRNEEGYLPDNYDKYLSGRYTLDDFINSLSFYDFKLDNYNPHDAISAELSTGLKK